MEWIVTDDIRRESWRRILEFSNIDLTVDEISRRHGPATADKLANYKKQAQQVRVCVLQAKEYFDAAAASTIFTSPNHVYYGVISLASMMMLILGTGACSLDALRRDSRNHHHGLNFTTGCTPKTVCNGLTLLDNSFAEVLRYGHFPNWYRTLPRMTKAFGLMVRVEKPKMVGFGSMLPGARTQSWAQLGTTEVPTTEAMIGVKKSIGDLLNYIPDLSSDLYRYQVHEPRSRSSHTVTIEDKKVTHQWALHGAGSPSALEVVLSHFSVVPGIIDNISYDLIQGTNGAVVTIAFEEPLSALFKWPTSRETLNHDTVSYAKDDDTHEIVDLYIIGYQLSMMSRYYPDLWIKCIESQCRAAKLIESAVDILVKKFPILVLSMLSPNGMTISTHRPPWAS